MLIQLLSAARVAVDDSCNIVCEEWPRRSVVGLKELLDDSLHIDGNGVTAEAPLSRTVRVGAVASLPSPYTECSRIMRSFSRVDSFAMSKFRC